MAGFFKRWMSAANDLKNVQNELRACADAIGLNWMHINPKITKPFMLIAQAVGAQKSFDLFNEVFHRCVEIEGWDKEKANVRFLQLSIEMTPSAERNPAQLYDQLKKDLE